METLPLVLKDDYGIRESVSTEHCCYCKEPIGQPHLQNCLVLGKRVKLKVTFVIERICTFNDTDEDIKGFLENSSSCANNVVHLMEQQTDYTCFCNGFEVEVLETIDPGPFRIADNDY